jgi:hypothetical protein
MIVNMDDLCREIVAVMGNGLARERYDTELVGPPATFYLAAISDLCDAIASAEPYFNRAELMRRIEATAKVDLKQAREE